MGAWVYLNDRIIMQDRAATFGDRGFNGTGDFSATLERLGEKRYAKILVRNLHAENFWYDHETWARPSGVKQALLANYTEVRRIPGLEPGESPAVTYGLNDISVLVPKPN
jgi:hypothetical protein